MIQNEEKKESIDKDLEITNDGINKWMTLKAININIAKKEKENRHNCERNRL